METKTFASKVAAVQDRKVTGISAVSGVVDAGLDLIHKGAFQKTILERLDRIKHLWQHDSRFPPIATIKELREVGRMELPDDMKKKYPSAKGGLLVVREYLDTERANEVFAGLVSDPPAITEMSFGYDPVKFDFEQGENGATVRNLRELRLWDTSDVNWGMNEATVASFAKSLPFTDTGTIEVEWKEPTLKDFTSLDWQDLEDSEKQRIASHFAWSENEVPEKFDDLKLPHHQPSKDGVGPAVLSGLELAMKQLSESKNSNIRNCYDHLNKHYLQFSKEAPKLQTLELLWSIDSAITIYDSTPDVLQKLKELDHILRAEPTDPSLTLRIAQEKLFRKLALKKRELQLSN